MPSVNPGPASQQTVNTQSPYSPQVTFQTIAVNITPVAIGAAGVSEQSFGAAGVTQVTAATGIKAGDVIVGVSPPSVGAATGPIAGRVDPAVNDKFYIDFVATAAATPPAGLYLITVARFNQSTRPPNATTYSFVPTSMV